MADEKKKLKPWEKFQQQKEEITPEDVSTEEVQGPWTKFAQPEPEEPGFLEEAATWVGQKGLEGAQWLGEKIERYDEAPGRAGVSAALEAEGLEKIPAYAKGWWGQMGEDPEQAPSYEDLAQQMGFPESGPSEQELEEINKVRTGPLGGGAQPMKPGDETFKGDVYPAGGDQIGPKEAAAGGMALVGTGPLSIALTATPAKWLGKGLTKLHKAPLLPVTLPFGLAKNLSGIDKKALDIYVNNLGKVDAYLETYGLDGIKELSKVMREKFNTRVDMFTKTQNRLIEEVLRRKSTLDSPGIDITPMFDDLNEMIEHLDPIANADEISYLKKQRNKYLRYFDEPQLSSNADDLAEYNATGVPVYRSAKTGERVEMVFDEKGVPTAMVKEIDGQPVTLDLSNRVTGDDRYIVTPQTAYNIKKKLQDLSYGVGEKESWISETGPVKASLRSASYQVRRALHEAVPEIALADTALSKIHLAQKLVKRGLIDPVSSEHAMLAAGKTGGGYDTKVLQAMEAMLTDPKKADSLEIFQDSLTKQVNLLKEKGLLEDYALQLGMAPGELEALAKTPIADSVKDGVRMRGVPELPGADLADPSTSLAKEADLLYATKKMGEAGEQYMPKSGAFLGSGAMAIGSVAYGRPFEAAAIVLGGFMMSPAAIKTMAKTGAKIQLGAGQMAQKAVEMGFKVVDGVLYLTPKQMEDIIRNVVGTPLKMGGYAAEKAYEIMQSPMGTQILGNALKATMAGDRLDLSVPGLDDQASAKITTPEQATAYQMDVKANVKLSNIEKFKRIQKANKEKQATLDVEMPPAEPVMTEPTSKPDIASVFKVLKGG